MKTINKLILLSGIAALCFSCSDFLDTYPVDGIGSNGMWKTEEHVDLGVTAAYSAMTKKGSYSRNALTDAYTEYAFLMSSGFDELGQRYFCYNTATTGYAVFSTKWQADYLGVQYANLAIENIPNVEMKEETRDRYLAEVRFLRAFYYFDLLTFYSGHKTDDIGIPLYDKMPDYDNAYKGRSTPADVRALMIEDLSWAAEHLPWRSSEKGRVNRAAALAVLGKVYLYADQYAKAVEVFAQMMKDNEEAEEPYVLHDDYAEMFTLAGENNTEYVFVISCLDTYGSGSYIDLLYNNRSANCSGTNTSIPTIYLANAYLNKDGSTFSWNAYPNFSWSNEEAVNKLFANRDPRLEASLIRPWALFVGKDNVTYQYRISYDTKTTPYPCLKADNGFNDHYLWRKFCNTGNETSIRRHSPTDVPLIRWADVMLLYAEALNESEGPSNKVYAQLDQIRARVGMPAVKRGGQEAVRQLIRNERVYELAGEGFLFADYQRWYAHDPSFDYESLNHTIIGYQGSPVQSKAGTRAFTPRNWRYAVPQTEIDQNPAIVQAPGWEN